MGKLSALSWVSAFRKPERVLWRVCLVSSAERTDFWAATAPAVGLHVRHGVKEKQRNLSSKKKKYPISDPLLYLREEASAWLYCSRVCSSTACLLVLPVIFPLYPCWDKSGRKNPSSCFCSFHLQKYNEKTPHVGWTKFYKRTKRKRKKKGSRRKRWRTQLSVYEQIPDF